MKNLLRPPRRGVEIPRCARNDMKGTRNGTNRAQKDITGNHLGVLRQFIAVCFPHLVEHLPDLF